MQIVEENLAVCTKDPVLYLINIIADCSLEQR